MPKDVKSLIVAMNYENKNPQYYSNVRYDAIKLIDKNQKDLKILEIGAAYGETLFHLKEKNIANEVIGIDLFEDKNNTSRYKKLDKFIFGDIDKLDVSEYNTHFDLILLLDVLEHIVEPKSILKKTQELLKNDGEVIISIPNIRHYSAMVKIFFKGNFRYEESGVFDYTHLRFYCKKDMIELLEKNGFSILYYESSIKNFKGKSITKFINFISFGVFEEFFSTQYLFKVKKYTLNNL